MSTKAIPRTQIDAVQAQHAAQQQQLHFHALQILLTGYKDVPTESPLKSKLELAIIELLQPFIPQSNVIQ